MTRTITFNQELAYPGQKRASLTVEIVPATGANFELPVVLDTGAAISKFDHALASRLGIANITNTPRTFQARAVDEQIATGYVHDVTLIFLGNRMTIPVAFCPAWPTGGENLLGMEGFFAQGLFAFDHAHCKVHFNVWPASAH
jgi:hypothetical protein